MAAKNKRHINLLPKEDFERTTLGRIMKWALTSFRFIVIAVEFIVICGFLLRFWLDVQISDLDDEITQKSALISSKSEFEKEFRSIQTKILILNQITSDKNLSLAMLNDVAGSLPADSQIISFSKEGGTLEVSGATLNEASISSFIANLSQKDKFGEISLREITTEEGKPFIEFRLEIELSGTV